jgi:hypothetical protein
MRDPEEKRKTILENIKESLRLSRSNFMDPTGALANPDCQMGVLGKFMPSQNRDFLTQLRRSNNIVSNNGKAGPSGAKPKIPPSYYGGNEYKKSKRDTGSGKVFSTIHQNLSNILKKSEVRRVQTQSTEKRNFSIGQEVTAVTSGGGAGKIKRITNSAGPNNETSFSEAKIAANGQQKDVVVKFGEKLIDIGKHEIKKNKTPSKGPAENPNSNEKPEPIPARNKIPPANNGVLGDSNISVEVNVKNAYNFTFYSSINNFN